MSGFLDRMAARAQGAPIAGTPAVHLRRRARFEPAPDGPSVDSGAATILQAPRSEDPWTVDDPIADRAPAAADRRRPRRAPRPETAAAPADTGPEGEREAYSRPEASMGPTPPVLSAASPLPTQSARPPHRQPPSPETGAGEQQPLPPTTGTPDPLVVVRDRVVPVLAEAGVFGAAEEVEVVDAAASAPTSAGARRSVQLRVETPHQSRADYAGYASGRVSDIHVHIGRIEVVRPPAPPPPPLAPAAPARRGTAADHAAYLARRRERG